MGMFIGIITLALIWIIGSILKSKFRKFSLTSLSSNLSGKEIAEYMLKDNGIYNVKVLSVAGKLTDHYNPSDRTVNLSPEVYDGRNAAAAAIAAHECGHAVQHANAFAFLQFRSSLVPLLSVTSTFIPWVIMIGAVILSSTGNPLVLMAGVAFFALTTLFSFITLPVEFDASRRALLWIEKRGIVTPREYGMAKEALSWAAMTYVVAALGSLGQLVYYISLLENRRD